MDNIYILQRYIKTGIESEQEILGCFKSVEDAKSKLQKFWEKDKNAFDIKTTYNYHNKWPDDENFEYDCNLMDRYVANHLKSYIYNLWIEKFDIK